MTLLVLGLDRRGRAKSLLAALGSQLVPGDVLCILAAGDRPDAASSWREVRSGGRLVHPGAPPGLRPVITMIDDRVAPCEGLLQALAEAIDREDVGVVSARSNLARGDELLVGVPYRSSDPGARRAHLRTCSSAGAGKVTAAELLDGPCMSFRRSAVEAAGGLGGLLSRHGVAAILDAAKALDLRLVVAEAAYVHHPGGPPVRDAVPGGVLVSACLIVKDEEHELEACLVSAQDVADEIVVYDTGSTDGTVALARRLGAQVIEGYWDDDFGRARNAALERCRGAWILWLDGDETLSCQDPATLRQLLGELTAEVEGLLVHIDNLQGSEAGTAMAHPAVRLFRRAYCHWEGRLHEQVVPRAYRGGARLVMQELARITHRGYLQHALRDRDKAARNLRSAFGDLSGDSELDLGTRLLSLGRSHILAGHLEEGADLCRRALEMSESGSISRLALRSLGTALLALRRPDEVLELVERSRSFSTVPALGAMLEGEARLQRGEHELALAAFDLVGDVVDEDGFEYHPSLVATNRAATLIALDRPGDAADTLLATLAASGGLDAHLGRLVEALEAAGRDLGEILASLRPERIVAFVPQVLQLQPEVADRVIEAWHLDQPTCLPILATAAELATRLPVERQLVWSHRLRSGGLTASCPLVSAAAGGGPAPGRIVSATVAWSSFRDPRALQIFAAAVAGLPEADRREVREAVAVLGPELLDRFDELVPAVPPAAVEPPAPDAAAVLVVSRVASGLRGIALAADFAERGHRVFLLHPLPTSATGHLLAERQVTVLGWPEPEGREWQDQAEILVAHCYALATLDAVVLTEGAQELAPAVAALIPTARLVVDDLAEPSVPSSIAEVLAVGPTLGRGARHGICVAADRRGQGASSRDLDELVVALVQACPGSPIGVLGDLPAGVLAGSSPAVFRTGPLADPASYLRSAQGLVVARTGDDAQWLHLAAAAGTPAVVVDPEVGLMASVSALATAIAAGSKGACASVSASGQRRAEREWTGAAADPLADLRRSALPVDRPRRRHSRSERPCVLLRAPDPASGLAATVVGELGRHLSGGSRPFDLVVIPEGVRPEASSPALELCHEDALSLLRADGPPAVCLPTVPYGGLLPRSWVGRLRDLPVEIWVAAEAARRAVVDSGIDRNRVRILPLGADIDRFRPDGGRRILGTSRARRLLFVGPCTETSGIDALIETYLSSFSSAADATLVLALEDPPARGGRSGLPADVRRAVSGVGEAIEVIEGPLSDLERAALYRSCDAFVQPSRADARGLRIAEAMASGLPVVVTDEGACCDAVDDEVGWLVASHPVPAVAANGRGIPGALAREPRREALARVIEEILSDPDEVRRRGAAARARAVTTLSWEVVAERAAGYLEALLFDDSEPAPLAPDLVGAGHHPC